MEPQDPQPGDEDLEYAVSRLSEVDDLRRDLGFASEAISLLRGMVADLVEALSGLLEEAGDTFDAAEYADDLERVDALARLIR